MGNEYYKFTREDFGPQPIIVNHMDLDFDVYDDHTDVISTLKFTTRNQPLKELTLNAWDIEMKEVTCVDGCTWRYDKDARKVFITFNKEIPSNTKYEVMTNSVCIPTKHFLEGLYFDETPEGAPPQQITQCQQWGFQRIVPSVDEMNAKCTYNTTIKADKRYTNILTNGDLTKGPIEHEEGRVQVWYDNTITPMATYLFFLGVGTYATFTREFEYPDGSLFTLELLCPPGTDADVAAKSLDLLFEGVLYIYLYTGRDKYENKERADEIYKLVKEREALKAKGKDCSAVQSKLAELVKGKRWGYKYTGTVYREIGMQNSNYGGMENVGNTTISTNRLLPSPDSSDALLEYIAQVKTHEFYHNLNGSEVTGMTPFEFWLNEAVTVYIEQQFSEFLFGADYERLSIVQGIISPDGGTLQQDEGAIAMPILPEGFNTPDELVTSVTYVKAPEFVRMIERILGKETFVKALADYHETFKHGNATTADWLDCMQAYTSVDVHEFAQSWLKKTGFPIVQATHGYDVRTRTYTITLTQQPNAKGTMWQYPMNATLCAADGSELASKEFFVSTPKEFVVTFEYVDEPAYVSLNRGFAFFGKLYDMSITREQRFLQVRTDKDVIARYFSYYYLWDEEKTRLLKNPQATPDDELISLNWELLNNETLMHDVGPLFLAKFESVEDPAFMYDYEGVYQVRKKISLAQATTYQHELLEKYDALVNEPPVSGPFIETFVAGMKQRRMKGLYLAMLAKLDTPQIHKRIRESYDTAVYASEKNLAALLYLESSASDKAEWYEEFKQFGVTNLRRWEVFLSITAQSDTADVLRLIRQAERMPEFRIEQSNDSRALYFRFIMNRRLSLLTEWGRAFTKEVLLKMTPVNEYVTILLLKQFGNIDKLKKEEDRIACYTLLQEVQSAIDTNKYSSVGNNLKRLLDAVTIRV